MVVTKGYGLTIDDIDWSCPADLEPYVKAHKEEIKEKDFLMHEMGLYNKLAFEVVMAHFGAGLTGKKSDAKYIEKPMMMRENIESTNANKESQEEIAVFEMKQRIKILRQSGLPESPI